MDKYQEFLAKELEIAVVEAKKLSSNDGDGLNRTSGAKNYSFRDGRLEITQNDNYNVNEYEVLISNSPTIDKVWIVQDGVEIQSTLRDERVRKIIVDFNKKAPCLNISFKNNLADPIEIPIKYIEADKAKWDETVKKELSIKLAQKVNVHFIKGDSFVDIVFTPVNDNYDHTKITLFYKYTEKGSSYTQLMGEYESGKERFFIPVLNLGHGSYVIHLRQFGEHNNAIYESDELNFSL